MSILNENLEWNHLAAKDRNLQQAFSHPPDKIQLPVGSMLCRFITTESVKKGIRGNEIFNSPWWADWSGTVTMLKRWGGPNIDMRNVVRGRLAITSQFNQQMDSVVQIILTAPVVAWKGTTHYQTDNLARVTYIGGGTQFFVPNLAADLQGLSSQVAYLHCFTSIESLQ
jgi:hypothetical protein